MSLTIPQAHSIRFLVDVYHDSVGTFYQILSLMHFTTPLEHSIRYYCWCILPSRRHILSEIIVDVIHHPVGTFYQISSMMYFTIPSVYSIRNYRWCVLPPRWHILTEIMFDVFRHPVGTFYQRLSLMYSTTPSAHSWASSTNPNRFNMLWNAVGWAMCVTSTPASRRRVTYQYPSSRNISFSLVNI